MEINESKKEYIQYLSNLNDDKLSLMVEKYHRNNIDFNKLEKYAIENMFLSKKNYYKFFKLGNLLRN